MSLFGAGIETLQKVEVGDTVRTQTFLDVCRLVLKAVDHLGPGFLLVKSDVGGNIDRLAARTATNPTKYDEDVYTIVLDEVEAGDEGSSSSCTKGLLWLTRAMTFVTALLQQLVDKPNESLSAIASETYYATLQKYHGWIVTGTFTVALKIVPSRETFLESIGADNGDGLAAMSEFCDEFSKVLSKNIQFLESHGLNDPTKV